MKKLGIVILLALMLILGLSAAASADTVASGNCGAGGDNLTWTLDDEGLLTISGTGAMADYYPSSSSGFGVMTKVNVGHVFPDPDEYYALGVTMLTAEGKATYYNTDVRYNVGLGDEYEGDKYLGWLINYNIDASGKFVVGTVDDNTRMLTQPDFGFVSGNDTGFVPLCPAGMCPPGNIDIIEVETDERGFLSKNSYLAIDDANAEIEDVFSDYTKHSANAMKITKNTVIFEITADADGVFESAALGDPADYIGTGFCADQFSIFAWDGKEITVLYVVNPFFTGDIMMGLFDTHRVQDKGHFAWYEDGTEIYFTDEEEAAELTDHDLVYAIYKNKSYEADSVYIADEDAPAAEDMVAGDFVCLIVCNGFALNGDPYYAPIEGCPDADSAKDLLLEYIDGAKEVTDLFTIDAQFLAINDLMNRFNEDAEFIDMTGKGGFDRDSFVADAEQTGGSYYRYIFVFDKYNYILKVFRVYAVSIEDLFSDKNVEYEPCDGEGPEILTNTTPGTNAVSSLSLGETRRDMAKSGDGEEQDAPWASMRSSIERVVIEDGVTVIGANAFAYCENLSELTLPASVTSIGDNAFSGCDSLGEVRFGGTEEQWEAIDLGYGNDILCDVVPQSVYAVEGGYIYFAPDTGQITGCDASVTSAVIPSSINGVDVTSIGEYAFDGRNNLTDVIIHAGLLSIGGYAFSNCVSLVNISIPDSVSDIGIYAFYNCTRLTSVALPNGTFVSIDEGVFEGCSSLTSVTIPDSVTSIGDYAFLNCSSLTSVTIADSVTSIGDNAFECCDSLTGITIGSGVTSIGRYAFRRCDSLTGVTIPDSVTSIGLDAFEDCSSLTNVTIGSGVTSIGDWAFEYCTSLTEVTIPDSVIGIGRGAFYGCHSLTGVTIGSGVTSIGEHAFVACYSLTEIIVGSGNAYYSSLEGVLFNKDKTELICWPGGKSGTYAIPYGVTGIGDYAFEDCDNLTGVTIPDSVNSIGEGAFYQCARLTGVTIGSGVTSIGYYAFENCDSLTGVTIPNSVTSIGLDAFAYCDSLTSVIVDSGVIGIGRGAFEYCRSLTGVTIPDSVTVIWDHAFNDCDRLTDVYYGGTEEQWAAIYVESGNDDLLDANIQFNYVENHLTVTVDQSGENWLNGELYVPIGGDAELKVIASATDGDLSYRWVKECEGNTIVEEWMDSTSATLAISNVTEDALYICYVTDMYGTERYAAICVRAGEVFSASAVGDRDIYLVPGGSATLQVSVNAGDLSEIEYAWGYEYYDAETGDYRCEELDGLNGDTYTVTNADKSAEYHCYVTRRVYDYDNVLSDGFIDDRYETVGVYFNVYINNSFSAWAVGGGHVNVAYNETATLEVQTSATVTTGMTYSWTQVLYDEYGIGSDFIDLTDNDNSITTSPVTKYSSYYCIVTDCYGNYEHVWFFVGVDNNLSVDIDRTAGGRWDGHSLYVSAGAPAEIRVLAEATDAAGLEYQWYQVVYYDDGTGDWILLSNNENVLALDAVTYSAEYRCRVRDRFGNDDTVWFNVSVDNNLSVTMDSDIGTRDGNTVYVSYGDEVTLTVTATADVTEGITYEWIKYVYNEDGELVKETLPAGLSNTLALGPVNKYGSYFCAVRDQYGNTEDVWCMVGVDNDFSARAKGETTLLVPYNATPTLEVEVSGNDTDDVSYFWYKVDYTYNNYGYWQGGDMVEYEYDSPTIETDPITTRCIYYCTVWDRFYNYEYLQFEVGVDNDFSATVDGTDKTYIEIEVPVGETASMKVKAEADDSDDITYRWYSVTPPTDENGDPIPVATGSDLQLIDSSGVNDTLEVKATKSKMYFSRVIDKFANMVEVFFHVKVANDLAVTPKEENITVPSGSDQTLTVTPSALDDEGIRYSWQKASYNDQGEFWNWWDGFGSGQSLTLENLTAPISYRCQVTDKYDNTVFSVFNISLTYGDEGDVQVEVDPGVVDEEVVFVAELLAEADIPAAAPENAVVYDLYFENEEDERVQPSSAVTVSIPVPNGMTGSKCKVYYIDGDQLTDMRAKCNADGEYLTFTADHFSYYAVVEGFSYLPGDINGDGTVNNKDVTRLMRYLKYKDVDVVTDALDVNGDGVVNNKDVTRLMRYIKYGDVDIH